MHTSWHRISSRTLSLALVLAAGCQDQITQPPLPMQVGAPQASKAPFKNVIALEPLPGTFTSSSSAYDINDLGQVVGWSISSDGLRAVIWDNSTIPLNLGTLPGNVSSQAAAISADGRIIAGTSSDGTTSYAVRWLSSSAGWLIDQLPSSAGCFINGMSSDGTAIVGNCNGVGVMWLNGSRVVLANGTPTSVNTHGQVVGTNPTFDRALLWTYSSGSVDQTVLGTLGGSFAVAMHINDAGEITGWSENADHVSHAFLWSPKKNAMIDLGPGGPTGGGYGMNATAQVVGDRWPSNTEHAALYDQGKVVDLGILPGYANAVARALNNNGQAVGSSSTTTGQVRATEWILK